MYDSFSSLLVTFMIDIAWIAGVPLIVATIVGLVVAFLQAMTQVQDQTLSQTLKIGAVVLTLILFGIQLSKPLMVSTKRVFENFAHMVQ